MGEFLGNLLGGAAQGGSSGSIGAGRGNIKQKNNYIGENDNQKPLEDIMGLLAGEANQQRAQRNLMFGGAGYGGSFESADQRAARANGESLTQKPLGGWGGYGSENPVMSWDPTNTRPSWAKQAPATTPAGAAPPPPPPEDDDGTSMPAPLPEDEVMPANPPSGGGTGTPAPPPQGPGNPPPKGTPWNGETGGFTLDAFMQALQQAAGKQSAAPAAGAPPAAQAPAAQWTDKDAAGLAQAQREYKAQAEKKGTWKGTYPTELTQEAVLAKKTAQGASQVAGMANGGGAGEKLITDLMQSGVMDASQGVSGSMSQDVENALRAGVSPDAIKAHYQALSQELGPNFGTMSHGSLARLDPAKLKDGTQTQATLANAKGAQEGLLPGGAAPPPGKAAPPGGANMTQTVPQNESYAASAGYTAPPGGENMTQTVPPVEGGDEEFDPSQYGPYFQQIWDQYQNAVKGEAWNQDPDSDDGTVTGSTGGGNGGGGGGGSDIAATTPQRASPFGPQGNNPDYEPGETTADAGYSGGDAWSTSAGWRPEEPTGGLYGAYSELASGQLTPYENRILEGWQGRAVDPTGWADEETYNSINQYAKTPGRGEDEAYGAYNKMLQGGYSPEEQNAITQEGMKAARAGFEGNRDAMVRNQARTGNSAGYAANMAKMARGFGSDMGSMARQNQITFADEAQRRATTGAQGMLNVAGLSNQRGQNTIQARQSFGNELARRQETAIGGMQSAAGYGRGLQQQGLQGMHALYTGQDPTKQWATAAGVASNPRETYTESGNASL